MPATCSRRRALPVLPGDDAESLGRRVLEREHPLLVQTVARSRSANWTFPAMPPLWRGTPLRLAAVCWAKMDFLEAGK